MSHAEAWPDSLSVSLEIQPLYLNVEGVENKGLLNGPFFIFSFLFSSSSQLGQALEPSRTFHKPQIF